MKVTFSPIIRKLAIATLLALTLPALGEDGSRLWLRYDLMEEPLRSHYAETIKSLVAPEQGEIMAAAIAEIDMAMEGLTGRKPERTTLPVAGSLVIVTSKNPLARQLVTKEELAGCGNEGFLIRSLQYRGQPIILIAANTPAGALYGTFRLIALMQSGNPLGDLHLQKRPGYKFRLLNHWDNLDGTVERGYAGRSIWWNNEGDEEQLRELYTTYARANASIGINGASINNVNASPQVLTPEYIDRFARFAGYLRPYNMKIYMSVNFSSPKIIGGLATSDPFDPKVRQWWKDKVKEIYTKIPDFGGFLVKANSEGQPGPQDFGRTHADGANMLAEALEPYNGIVMWRAFVYQPEGDDRAKQAYTEFKPLDGQFHPNVIVQVKNGPVDFQPREPFSPLFGAMQKTPLMAEFQITQEYLGFSSHLVYLAPLQKEVLDADTYARGPGSTVAKTTDGTLYPSRHTAIAGVANIGRDTNWTGHHFAQANWYAYGRLAWDPGLRAGDIADEWLKMTFTRDERFVRKAGNIMMRSREAAVNYMTPLGLHHLMGWDHHYGPEPWTWFEGARPDWLPSYYHKADTAGIGFDRSPRGSNAVEQYFSPLREQYGDPGSCPDELLLWFHHLPWDYPMRSGRTLWNELAYRYTDGMLEAREFQKIWDMLEGAIDDKRFQEVQYKLKVQAREAQWWRDACLLYFQTFSRRHIPAELERPVHDLQELQKQKFDLKHQN